MSTSAVNYNLQNLYGSSGPQNLFGTGSNQYGGGWPSIQTPSPGSYSVPPSGSYNAQTPSLSSQPGGYYTGTTYDPQLTSSLFGYLGSQVGQGLPAYQGQLTAAPNELYGQLGSLLTGGQSNLPYGQQMLQMAQTGNPTDVGPAWEAMKAASQQNIAENQAALKEQYAAGGNLVGTPYGSAMSDYMSQTALGENAILTQAQQQAAEAAAGRQLSAQQGLTSADLSLGGNLQNIAQTGATNAYNEWLRQQPQYNPLLSQAYGASTTFPPYLNPQQSPWAMIIPAILNSINIPGLSKQPPGPPGTPGAPGAPGSPGGGGGGGGGGAGGSAPGGGGSAPPPGSRPTVGSQQGAGQTLGNYQSDLISNYLSQYLQGGSDPTSAAWQNLIGALGGGQGPQAGGIGIDTPAGTGDIPAQPYYPSQTYDPTQQTSSNYSDPTQGTIDWASLMDSYGGGGGGGSGDMMSIY